MLRTWRTTSSWPTGSATCSRPSLRVDPDDAPVLLTDARARPFVMRGRELAGWLNVRVDDDLGDVDLGLWVERGVRFARALPPP